ncbi:MAG: DNA primase [Candidatus Falkowbacteria bacterium]
MLPAEEIKAHLDIVEVLREYIQLKPAGANFQALCPFHNEKSPSFLVSAEKQIWHCFGCGKGGDVIKFVMEKESLTFPEALRLLAPKAGIELQQYSRKESSFKTRILDCLEEAANFYHRMLEDGPNSSIARDYLEKRGLSDEVIEDWKIGFSPDSWDDLINHLKSKGYSEREIEGAGLVSRGQGGSRFYNRFRRRVMFPICDAGGQVVAFTARLLPGGDDKMGKYINSPATIVYDKSKMLFGLDKAKTAIHAAGEAVIVEGQMDCITAHQFGFKNVVASSGTALGPEQFALLNRYTENVVLALDADQAGQAAAERAGEMMAADSQQLVESADRWGRLKMFIDPSRSQGKNIKIVEVPLGKDPDDAIRQNIDAWRQALLEAKSLAGFLFDRSIKGLDLGKVEGKKQAVARFLPVLDRLESPVEKDYWLKKLALAVNVETTFLNEALAKINRPSQKTGLKAPAAPVSMHQPLSREEVLSERLLSLVLKFNAYVKYISDYIDTDQLGGIANQALYSKLIIYYNEARNTQGDRLEIFALDYAKFKEWLLGRESEREAAVLDKLSILAEKEFFNYDTARADQEIKMIARELKTIFLNKRRREISSLISQSDVSGRPEEQESLLRELAILNEELRRLITL